MDWHSRITVHLTPKSSNSKTGKIPVSTTVATSCPSDCAMRHACYAKQGPLKLHWDKVGARGTDWATFCDKIANLPDGQLWRHNQAGDLPGDDLSINAKALAELVQANEGKRGFTYTHKPLTPTNVKMLKQANEGGFTVNVSANGLEDLTRRHGLAPTLPWTTVVPEAYKGTKSFKHEGFTIVTCPATYREGVTCETCQLCQRAKRNVVVAFPVHGSGKNKVEL